MISFEDTRGSSLGANWPSIIRILNGTCSPKYYLQKKKDIITRWPVTCLWIPVWATSLPDIIYDGLAGKKKGGGYLGVSIYGFFLL